MFLSGMLFGSRQLSYGMHICQLTFYLIQYTAAFMSRYCFNVMLQNFAFIHHSDNYVLKLLSQCTLYSYKIHFPHNFLKSKITVSLNFIKLNTTYISQRRPRFQHLENIYSYKLCSYFD